MLPQRFARKHKIILIYQFGDAITAAMQDPGNSLVVEEVERITKRKISPVFAFPEEIEEAIDIQYQSTDSVIQLSDKIDLDKLMESSKEVSLEELQRIAGDEAVIEFTRSLLMLGIKERASDIHIEPGEESIRVRYRIDGVLQERLTLDKSLLAPLVSRIKVIAGVNIVEKRRPQDGRITLSLPKRSLDLRFSTVPTIYGEKIVLRILGQTQMRDVPDLRVLEFSTAVLSKLERVIDTPNGVFFVTGPTGSGKTTTLYAVLNHLNTPGINIMTIEDPVEYRLPGINQIQVNPAIDLDFASALRSFLRQDPDVILVGEIRDVESARIAAQAALTGHLVMSTMHTNNALQAVTRLIEVGVEPFLVAPSIIGVMAQRLVRRICDHCKEARTLTPQEIEELFYNWDGKREVLFYEGKGCPQCNHTGYFGRLAIHEIFIINDEVRELIAKGASILTIQECAKRYGFMNMRYDGIKKVLRGLTTIEEVDRVTVLD
jgi:type IV pilus assembly protein PilB